MRPTWSSSSSRPTGWKSGLSIVSFRPNRLSLPETMISAPGWRRRSMKRRPNHVASMLPVASSRAAIVRWIRRRNDGWTRTSATRTRALTTIPSSTQTSSPTWRISRRSSYRRGRWKSSSRTVRKPSRRPARWSVFAAPRPESRSIVSSRIAGSVGGGGAGGRRRAPRAAAGRPVFALGPVTPLLGRDQVAVVRLAAVDDLDLGAGPLADPPGDGLRLQEGGILAVVEGDELAPLRERVGGREHGAGAVAVNRDEAVVRVERDRLAPLDLAAADLCVADGLRHLDGGEAAAGAGHRLHVRTRVEIPIEGEQSGDPLCRVPCRHDDEPTVLAQSSGLLRREPDV